MVRTSWPTGLGDAADGSGQLADGLAQAEPGGAQIEAGAGQLKEEGADKLADTGKEAQLGYARNVALLEAAQQAGLEGAGIPFGPAEGTDVVTTGAYKMYVAGVAADTENNALKFGLGALLIAGAGGAAFAAAQEVRRLADPAQPARPSARHPMIRVPGRCVPRRGLHPPHVASFQSGHSGSTIVSMVKPAPTSAAT